jgi:hypothetical protein
VFRETQSVLNDRVTTALGYAELLLEGSYGALNPEQKKALVDVVTAAREVRDIIRTANPKIVED